jgi:hypothetical protein
MEMTVLKKNNSIQHSVGNAENEYLVPDFNKTMINVTKEPSDTHTKTLNEDILEDITKIFMEKIQDMVNQKIQDALKKFQETKNKEHKKTQKQIKELVPSQSKQIRKKKYSVQKERTKTMSVCR